MCLQMFHRGHAKLLDTLMNAGHKLILGVHDDRSIFLNKGIRTGDPTITRVCNVRRMLRPQDEIFVVVDRDPTDCLKEVVPRLLRDGVDGGGDDYEETSGNFVDWRRICCVRARRVHAWRRHATVPRPRVPRVAGH